METRTGVLHNKWRTRALISVSLDSLRQEKKEGWRRLRVKDSGMESKRRQRKETALYHLHFFLDRETNFSVVVEMPSFSVILHLTQEFLQDYFMKEEGDQEFLAPVKTVKRVLLSWLLLLFKTKKRWDVKKKRGLPFFSCFPQSQRPKHEKTKKEQERQPCNPFAIDELLSALESFFRLFLLFLLELL